MEGTPEKTMNPESQERKPRVLLHIMRHGEKAGGNWNPDDMDHRIPLTDKGRQDAQEKHAGGDPRQGLAIGSGRIRADETALRALVGDDPRIKDIDDFDELVHEMDQELRVGSKLRTDSRLDIPFKKQGDLHEHLEKRASEIGYARAIAEEFDTAQYPRATVYGVQAANLASIVLDRITMERNWERLVERKPDEYTDTLERYIGTHGGVIDAFIGEILTTLHGIDARNTFIKTFPNCTPYASSCDIELLPDTDTVHVTMCIKRDDEEDFVLDEIVPLHVLEHIAGTGTHEEE